VLPVCLGVLRPCILAFSVLIFLFCSVLVVWNLEACAFFLSSIGCALFVLYQFAFCTSFARLINEYAISKNKKKSISSMFG